MNKSSSSVENALLQSGQIVGNLNVSDNLNLTKEIQRFRNDPLQPLLAHIADDEADLLQGDIGRYRFQYRHYSLALERVLRHISIGRRWHSEVKYAHGGRRSFSDRQKQIAESYRQTRQYCELDFITCLIHARILLDRTIAISARFLKGGRTPSFHSFNDHKKFCKKQSEVFTETLQTYRDCIVNQTDWFDSPLKLVRDKFAVHSGPAHIPFLAFGSNHDLEMCFVPDQRNPNKPFGGANLVKCSMRRLARDIEQFLVWYSAFAISVLGKPVAELHQESDSK